jgi:oligopeptide/dipeptide ABC transporter ATP-binding protein
VSGEGHASEAATTAPRVGPPILEASDLHVAFRGRTPLFARRERREAALARAVDGVDLVVHEGEIVALAGESGCGKTTLARALMGFVSPQRGQITFEGRPLGRDLRAYRRRVQMVYQDPAGSLNPRQTVYDAVVEGIRIHRLPGDEEELVGRALARAGLRPPGRFFQLFPHELSGGQRQRVVIAGALALEPRVIIADEPVSNLDASVRGEILRLLLELRRTERISLLIVTHDLGLAWTVADRVAVMYLGRIVEVGPTRAVLTTPGHPYTRALLDVLPEAGGSTGRLLRGEPPDPTRIPSGCRFHPRCPLVTGGEAARLGIEQRCRTVDVSLAELTIGHEAACHAGPAGAPPAS